MDAVAPHGPPAPEQVVHGLGHAHREPLAAARQPMSALGLDQEMDVIPLHGEVDDPEAGRRGGYEGAANGGEHRAVPQRRQSRGRAQRDMYRNVRIMEGTATMRHAAAPGHRGATGSGAAAAPAAKH
jgi:hypothetical protein